MSVTQSTCALSPASFSADADVLAEDLIAVIEQVNFAAGRRPVTHLSTDLLDHELGSSESLRVGRLITDADVQTIVVGATLALGAGATAAVTFTIDGVDKTINYTDVDDGVEKTDTFDVASDLGGDFGVLAWSITAEGTGSPTIGPVSMQEGEIAAADLPAPEDS